MILLTGIFKKFKNRLFNYRLGRESRTEADLAALMLMLDTVIALQVKTTYSLTYAEVAKMLAKLSGNLTQAADSDELSRKEKAMFLHMSSVLVEKAKELKFEDAKHASKN